MPPFVKVGYCLGLGAVLAPLGCWAAPAAMPPITLAADSRLQGRLTAVVPGRALSALLVETSQASKVNLTADEEAGDQKLIYVGRSQRVGELLDTVRKHFALRWVRRVPSLGDTAALGYRLTTSQERRGLATRLREAAERERTARLLGRMEKQLLALDASREQLRKLGLNDPYFDSSPLNAGQRARLQIVAWLPRAERARVASGVPFLSPSLDKLPAEVVSTLLVGAGLRNPPPDLSLVRYTFRRESEDGADHLTVRLLGADNRPVGRSADLVPTDPPRRGASLPVTGFATHPSRNPADPSLEREGELLDKQGRPLAITAGLPVLLESLARATSLDVLSDYYVGQTLRFEVEPIGKRPLWQLLNIVTEQFSLKWERRGTLLLFRHREWFEVEAEEIPERQLRTWHTVNPVAEPIDPKDFVKVITELTVAQLSGLRTQFPRVRLTPPFAWERWLATLDPKQQSTLLDGQPLSGTELGIASQEGLEALLAAPARTRVERIQTRMSIKDQHVELRVEDGGPLSQTQWWVPQKARGPQPIQLRIRTAE